jgi:hypothetical protein
MSIIISCNNILEVCGMQAEKGKTAYASPKTVWERGVNRVLKKFKIFFLLKFNMFYMFWIVLMC